MNRRKFIKNAAVLGGFTLVFPNQLFSKNKRVKICLLHTNDMHSRIDPFENNHSQFPNQGGMINLKKKIDEIRNQNANVLLFDCGDVLQGTPYFNLFKGEVEFKMMSSMKYDAGCIGNHDFDVGFLKLKENIEKFSTFPLLNCNYEFDSHLKTDKILTHIIKNIEGKKIGIFGVGIELEGLVDETLREGIKIKNTTELINNTSKFLKKDLKCDLVIMLSHLGFEYKDNPNKISDVFIAQNSKYIDIILGGHTHTFLDEPLKYKNLNNKEVIVNQAAWGGLRLGKIDIEI